MPENQREVVTGDVTVAATADAAYATVADLSSWPQFHPPAVHAEVLRRDPGGTLVRHWAVTGRASARTWQARWEFDPAARRIRFSHETPPAPLSTLEGEWVFADEHEGTCRATLSHTLTYPPGDEARVRDLVRGIARNTEELLQTARDTAARREELRSLVITFEDTVFIAGSVHDAYTFLYDAAAWPDRLPHVARLELEEPTPGIQFFDMDTKAPDGSTHTTRSVRVCRAPHLIVYKQTVTPALLDAHTGRWSFVETPEGVLASARHTATIKRSALGLLGVGTTVRDARRYLRKALSTHSVRNLQLAKEYAEERAGD
ncbi:aromatase [Amycolatopsis acidicola]|uniref:Aromatase n=1 Tax=Amycolatopsis acidicola TaxID=2596893 RepID=A0A5N0VJM1_9PSEU|nr:aromatase/cyclase [Amycolatopsis acidicola]KAA9166519.1 aromatase [Amycolatopsis acidicola]